MLKQDPNSIKQAEDANLRRVLGVRFYPTPRVVS